jgi:hypothetical protein
MSDRHEERLLAALEHGETAPELAGAVAEQRRVAGLLGGLGDAPAPDLTPGVMARIEAAERASLEARAGRGRRLRLGFGFAAAMGLALGVGFVLGSRHAPGPSPGAVTFVLVAPSAHSVAVAGDFNEWQPARAPLDNRDGVWTATIELRPGRYEYMFLVDGKEWVTDPAARLRRDDGFGNQNAILEL